MAAYELSIKATSLADLEIAIGELHQRFPGLPEEGPEADSPADAGQQPAARRGRPRGSGRVPAPASAPAAAEVPAAGDAAVTEGAGAAGSVEGAAGADVQAAEEHADAENEGAAAALQAQAGVDTPAAGSPAPGTVEETGSTGGPEATVEGVKEAIKLLVSQSAGLEKAKGILAKHGIAKPGQVPEEKAAEVMKDVLEAIG